MTGTRRIVVLLGVVVAAAFSAGCRQAGWDIAPRWPFSRSRADESARSDDRAQAHESEAYRDYDKKMDDEPQYFPAPPPPPAPEIPSPTPSSPRQFNYPTPPPAPPALESSLPAKTASFLRSGRKAFGSLVAGLKRTDRPAEDEPNAGHSESSPPRRIRAAVARESVVKTISSEQR